MATSSQCQTERSAHRLGKLDSGLAAKFLVALLVLLMLGKIFGTLPETIDETSYLAIYHGGLHVRPPFAWRVMTPKLASILPLSAPLAFRIITLLGLAAFALLADIYSRSLGLDRKKSGAAFVLCLSFYYPTIYYLQNPYMVDPIFLACVAMGAIIIVQDRPIGMAGFLAVSVLNKESILFLAPVDSFSAIRSRLSARIVRLILVVLPALLLLLALRAWVQPLTSTSSELHKMVLQNLSLGQLRSIISGVMLAGGPILILLPVGWKRLSRLAQRNLVYAAVFASPLVFIAADTGRMLAILLVFWIPFAVAALPAASASILWGTVASLTGGNLLFDFGTALARTPVNKLAFKFAGIVLLACAIVVAYSSKIDSRLTAEV